ncbi:MAG TPA: phospholipase D-like domain-containing protein [Thermoanaerobaculia bacterium]|nr:phospholipase D-like domain-containing protein [Thermoanaerobaculia bacterium]
MTVSFWVLGFLCGLVVLLALLLWSARTQRSSRVRLERIEAFRDLLPSISGLTQGWLVGGNRVEVLQNGDGFFPRLLADVAAAKESIHVESYVWWKGDICRRMAEALAARAEEGVEVRLLLDAVGAATGDATLFAAMKDAGVKLVFYHRFELRALGRLNQRTHRKVAVFDGRIGYVFSHGFAAEWEGAGDGPESWRDTGARLEGPVVGRVQAVFSLNWMEETTEVLFGERYFPDLPEVGDVTCQVVSSTPSGGVSSVSILHKLMIAAADSELLVQNPYFCPDNDLTRMLVAAAGRGVRVRIMVPGPYTDSPVVQHAGHWQFTRLLRAGIEIWEHQRTLVHQKVLVVDRLWCHLGSTNFDERSFDINSEVSLGILDEPIAAELADAFEADLAHCRRVELSRWRRRSPLHQGLDAVLFLIHEQL